MRRAMKIIRRAVPRVFTPASEDVTVNYAEPGMFFLSIVGATNSDDGLVTVLGDNSDATYLQGGDDDGLYSAKALVGFSSLLYPAGRNIASFVLIVRCSDTVDAALNIGDFTGIAVDGGGFGPTLYETADGITDITVGSFVKDGGGTWSQAQFDSMVVGLYFGLTSTSSTPRIYRVTARATYAP